MRCNKAATHFSAINGFMVCRWHFKVLSPKEVKVMVQFPHPLPPIDLGCDVLMSRRIHSHRTAFSSA